MRLRALPATRDDVGIRLSGVTAGYAGGRTILHDLDLEVPRGQCWAVLGPSGGGKTTLLRVILGQLTPRRGTVTRPCLGDGCTPRGGAIGYIPQNLGLVRNLTVRQNVLLGALARVPLWRTMLGRFPADELQCAEEAIEAVGLGGRAGERVDQLSGGQRRRVAIARAVVQRPALLLADEFLAELDRDTARDVTALLLELREATGMTMLFVDHDIDTACRIADRVVVVVDGRRIREMDPADAVSQRVPDLYQHLAAV